MIFDTTQTIKVKFKNGRQVFVNTISPAKKKDLEIRFDSQILSITGVKLPTTNAPAQKKSKRTYKSGAAWQKDHYNHNKAEKHEVAPEDRKREVRNRPKNKFETGGKVTEADVKNLYDKVMELFNNHINNGGNLDYSEKEYGYLNDELDDVAIGYFKEAPDGDYQEELVEQGFTLNSQEAYDILEHRLESINEELEEFKTGGSVKKKKISYHQAVARRKEINNFLNEKYGKSRGKNKAERDEIAALRKEYNDLANQFDQFKTGGKIKDRKIAFSKSNYQNLVASKMFNILPESNTSDDVMLIYDSTKTTSSKIMRKRGIYFVKKNELVIVSKNDLHNPLVKWLSNNGLEQKKAETGLKLDDTFTKNGDNYLHSSGYEIELHLKAGDEDWDGNPVSENMYIVLDQDGMDAAGEYMTLPEAKQMVLDMLEQDDEEFKTGGKTGDVVEYETKRIVNKNKREPFSKDTHFAIHKPTNSIVFSWDYKGYDKAELQSEKDSYFFQDIKDNVGGNVDKFVKSDFKIVERKNLQKDGINLNDYLAFVGQKYETKAGIGVGDKVGFMIDPNKGYRFDNYYHGLVIKIDNDKAEVSYMNSNGKYLTRNIKVADLDEENTFNQGGQIEVNKITSNFVVGDEVYKIGDDPAEAFGMVKSVGKSRIYVTKHLDGKVVSLLPNKLYRGAQWQQVNKADSNKTGGKTGSKKYSVWNWTDNISATAKTFANEKEAEEFIKQFRDRYKTQGYYRDNLWRQIKPEDIELEIYEIND